MQDPTGAIAWYNNSSLRPPQPQQRPSLGPGPLLSPRGGQKIRENAADNDIGGPIYEDIDRMCSYRGYPPPGKDTKYQRLTYILHPYIWTLSKGPEFQNMYYPNFGFCMPDRGFFNTANTYSGMTAE